MKEKLHQICQLQKYFQHNLLINDQNKMMIPFINVRYYSKAVSKKNDNNVNGFIGIYSDKKKQIKMSRGIIQQIKRPQNIKSQLKKKYQPNFLSVQHPIACSMQMKPYNSTKRLFTPNYIRQSITRCVTQPVKSRVLSAYGNLNSAIGFMPQKIHPNAINHPHNSKEQEYDIKWIGVHGDFGDIDPAKRHAFPKRKLRTSENSIANIMYKYGRQLRFSEQQLKCNSLNTYQQKKALVYVPSAATTKVRPRVAWYDKKRNAFFQRQQNTKRGFEVIWFKNQ